MKKQSIQFRPVISLTLFTSFMGSFISGLALYLRPEGELARLINWTWLGLDKKSWEQLHVGIVTLFVITALWHTVLNWKPLWHYVCRKSKVLTIHKWEVIVAALLALLFSFGAILRVPPFLWLSDLRSTIKSGTGMNSEDKTNKTTEPLYDSTKKDIATNIQSRFTIH